MSNAFAFFDRVYYINLDMRSDRRREIESEIRKWSISAERFPGILLGEFPDKTLRRLGNKLCHYVLVQKAKSLGLKNVLILEDDAVFVEDIDAKLNAAIEDTKKVPWDIFYIGYESFGYGHGTLQPVTDNIAKTQAMYLTHAYAINCTAYDKILNTLANSKLADAVDYAIVHDSAPYQIYCTTTKLAFQRPSISDIENAVPTWAQMPPQTS